ncbi:hypothetical protein MFUL124B02_26720 [Myxococcus fulvus 124B02]|nr:hypothetical protein MFUL124B02_26720 [Myxococcus fulvus 124B02]
MNPRNPDYRQDTEALFRAAPFVADLGIEPVSILPGQVEACLLVQRLHTIAGGQEKRVSKATVTLAVVEPRTP